MTAPAAACAAPTTNFAKSQLAATSLSFVLATGENILAN